MSAVPPVQSLVSATARLDRRGRRALFGFGLYMLAVLVTVAVCDRGLPVRWELPDGYRGWVVVLFEHPDCPAAAWDGIYRYVIPIDERGCGCTSDQSPKGWRVNHYEYVLADGARRRLPTSGRGGEILAGYYSPKQTSSPIPYSGDFVGSESELTAWGWAPNPLLNRDQQQQRLCLAEPAWSATRQERLDEG